MSFAAKRNRTIAAMRSLGEFDVGEGGRKVPWPLQHNEAVPPSAAPPSVNDAALRGFLNRIEFEAKEFMDTNYKIELMKQTFEYYALKQNLEYTDAKVTVSTVHGAKGLEWDFVFLPDMEKSLFPNYNSLCGECLFRSDCKLKINDRNEEKFINELSVFYVAVTRARKEVIFSASKTQLDRYWDVKTTNVSCLLRMPGIHLKRFDSKQFCVENLAHTWVSL